MHPLSVCGKIYPHCHLAIWIVWKAQHVIIWEAT